MSQTNSRLQGGGLILPQGSSPGSINVGEKALILDSDGGLKTQDSAGVIAPVGGTITTTHAVGADVQNFDITGLAGDTDGDYVLTGRIVMPNGVVPTISLQPNQISANQDGNIQSTVSSNPPATTRITSLMLAQIATDAAGTPYVWFNARLTALTGRVRRFLSQGTDFSGTTANTKRTLLTIGEWSDTTTVITSLRIATNVAASIKAGSFFVLQRTGINT